MRSYLPREGDQFVLDLFKGVPWGGRSPRGLTRVQIVLSLRREPPGREVGVDPTQLLLWPEARKAAGKRARRPEAGAPPLLPLKRTWRGSRSARRRFYEEG